jgi:hypothetical protein
MLRSPALWGAFGHVPPGIWPCDRRWDPASLVDSMRIGPGIAGRPTAAKRALSVVAPIPVRGWGL